MRAFRCRVCANPLHFENSVCVSCGSDLAFSRTEVDIVPIEGGRYTDADGATWHICRNLGLSGCTWLAATPGGQCVSCDLTRTRPNDADARGMRSFQIAERAKRRLIFELDRLGFEIEPRRANPTTGLCFDLLSNTHEDVVTGHDQGVITINLAEGDDAYRERVRVRLDEPYRTMLGHFRHEIGHYIEWRLVEAAGGSILDRARVLFGDERADYEESVSRHYAEGAPAGWPGSYISAYATMHPYEDFAETWAHYLHICDTIETSGAYGLADPVELEDFTAFRDVVTRKWIPLSIALNMVNRSMGKDDLYPFVIPAPVLDKLDFVASLRPGAGV
jgi:hypothetical protein